VEGSRYGLIAVLSWHLPGRIEINLKNHSQDSIVLVKIQTNHHLEQSQNTQLKLYNIKLQSDLSIMERKTMKDDIIMISKGITRLSQISLLSEINEVKKH
jgi:hypothetical protein